MTTRVARPGRKVQLIDVRVSSAEQDLAWGRALRIRRLDAEAPAAAGLAEVTASGPRPGRDPEAPPGPDDGPSSPPVVHGYTAFHADGVDLRFVGGAFDRRGPATVWIRLAVPLVPGEEPSPLVRVAAAADMGNGASSLFGFDSHLFINPDLSLFLDRPAVGPWICLDVRTVLGHARRGSGPVRPLGRRRSPGHLDPDPPGRETPVTAALSARAPVGQAGRSATITARSPHCQVAVATKPASPSQRSWSSTVSGRSYSPSTGVMASAGLSGMTTSPSTNRPPADTTAWTRPNSSALAAPSRWCTARADTTTSKGPGGSASCNRLTLSSTRAAGSV